MLLQVMVVSQPFVFTDTVCSVFKFSMLQHKALFVIDLQQISPTDCEFRGALHQLQRETQQEKQNWSCFHR